MENNKHNKSNSHFYYLSMILYAFNDIQLRFLLNNNKKFTKNPGETFYNQLGPTRDLKEHWPVGRKLNPTMVGEGLPMAVVKAEAHRLWLPKTCRRQGLQDGNTIGMISATMQIISVGICTKRYVWAWSAASYGTSRWWAPWMDAESFGLGRNIYGETRKVCAQGIWNWLR